MMFGSTNRSSSFGQNPAFGGFGSTPTQTNPFGSATQPSQPPFGSTTSAFGGQSSAFGSQTLTSAFGNISIGQSEFGGQLGGSRVASYSTTSAADGGTFGQTAKLDSISAMLDYKNKSHEELRWDDYQLGDKGSETPTSAFGNIDIGQTGFGGQPGGSRVACYSSTTAVDGGTFGQIVKLVSISTMSVYKYKSHEELRREDYQLGDKGSQTRTSAFGNNGIKQSGFGGQPEGSRVASYSATSATDGGTFGRTDGGNMGILWIIYCLTKSWENATGPYKSFYSTLCQDYYPTIILLCLQLEVIEIID